MKMGMLVRAWRRSDWLLIFSTLILLLFGLSAIYSVALSQASSDFLNLKKQLVAAAIGLGLFALMTISNYRLLRNYSLLLYLLGLSALAAVLWLGSTVRGTTGWFDLGPFRFQPVEAMKVILPIRLAAYFSERTRGSPLRLREGLQSLGMTALPVVLTLLQPDLGSALLLLAIWGVMVLFAGMTRRQVLALAVGAIVVGAIGWAGFLADYQRARLLTFLDPARDPLGQGYNVTQAVIAVGSGGWFGRGLGFGSQSQLKFIPESQTDFIFAVIAEELGFVGVLLVLGALSGLLFSVFRHARATPDDFAAFLLVGIGGSLLLQSLVNIGMNLGLMPVTGLGLPLVSYGGSSLLFTLLMLGMVNSVARSSPQAARPMVEWR